MRLAFVIYCVLVSSFVFAQSSGLKISQIDDNFFVYTTYNAYGGSLYPSNSMYAVTSEGIVMIDTPWDTTQFQPLLDSIEKRHHKKVVLCIATHHHEDRTGGLAFLRAKGIKTFSSKQTLELCKLKNKRSAQFSFQKDTTFTVGEYTFQSFYPGEGHTSDNIMIWVPLAKILYGGCFIKSHETNDLGNIADANIPAWEGSLKKSIKRFPKLNYVIPGHLDWNDTNAIAHTLYLVKNHLKKGK